MKETNSDYSLLECLDYFLKSLPKELADKDQLRLLQERARFFPPILRIGIECRMNDERQVDLQQCLLRDRDDLPYLLSWLKKQSIQSDGEWEALSSFFFKWANPSSTYHKNINEIFLEMDVLPGKQRVPLLFFSLDEEDKHKTNDFLIKVLQETLGKNRSFYPILERCFKSCPENASVFYAGIQFSRNIDAIRINIKNLYPQQVIPFLAELGYKHFTPELEHWINFVYSLSDRVRVCIDLGKSVFPKIGFECFWDDPPSIDTRWEAFLDELVSKDICLKAKAEAILSWDHDIYPHQSIPWPEHLWIQSLQKPIDEFTYLKRKVSHLKLSIDPLNQPELKSYLGYGNLWLKMGKGDQEEEVNKEAPLAEKTIDNAIDQGLAFILSVQKQSGAWIDFQLPPGKSDEWVTAYVGYYLSFFDHKGVEDSFKRAWDFLQIRYRPNTGWGYNVVTPADADSTLWAYLLSTRISGTDHLLLQNLLPQYFLNTGGVSTYLENDKIRKNTRLGKEASFDGWQSLHLCVTAAYALTGNKNALKSVIKNQNQDGSLTAYWWASDEYATALTVEAMSSDFTRNEKALKKAFDWSFDQLSISLKSPVPSVFNISFLIRALLFSRDLAPFMEIIEKGAAVLLTTQQQNGSWAPSAALRVPMPATVNPDEKENNWIVKDQNGIFTSITVLNTLNQINKRLYGF